MDLYHTLKALQSILREAETFANRADDFWHRYRKSDDNADYIKLCRAEDRESGLRSAAHMICNQYHCATGTVLFANLESVEILLRNFEEKRANSR